MAVSVLYLIRHGETYMNLELRCQGRVDTPLNENGRRQLEETAQELRGVRIDRIFTSPLKRAVESAEIVAARHGIAPVPLDWLTEVDHGELEGMDQAEAERHSPGLIYQWWDHPHKVKFPGGESVEDVTRRVVPGLLELIENESGTVVIVTHQVVTGTARCIMQDRPMSELWDGKLVNGKYLRVEPDAVMIQRLRDRAKQSR